ADLPRPPLRQGRRQPNEPEGREKRCNRRGDAEYLRLSQQRQILVLNSLLEEVAAERTAAARLAPERIDRRQRFRNALARELHVDHVEELRYGKVDHRENGALDRREREVRHYADDLAVERPSRTR